MPVNNPTPQDVIAAARMAVFMRHPYLSAVLFALRPVARPGLGTLAVDAGWRLYYDPETVMRWYAEELAGKLDRVAGHKGTPYHDGVAGVVFHEIGHCLREHHKRMRELAEADPKG